jgi:hypothetical protein
MIAPKWTSNQTQPIAINDVLDYLVLVLAHPSCIGERFEIGGPSVLSYKEVLLEFARIRGLKRWIISVPVLTPKLSSYWLYFITSASFPLSRSLVESLKNNAICKENRIQGIFPKKLMDFESAVRSSFQSPENHVPCFGILSDIQVIPFKQSPDLVQEKIWSLGGSNGWLYMDWAWKIRGVIDKLVGGVGLRRGRRHPTELKRGDALDFWRVLVADRADRHLLLYAEMKLPGEAWLEFKIIGQTLYQTATFRPLGLLGRFYWYFLFPFHYLIFRRMAHALVNSNHSS